MIVIARMVTTISRMKSFGLIMVLIFMIGRMISLTIIEKRMYAKISQKKSPRTKNLRQMYSLRTKTLAPVDKTVLARLLSL